MRFLKEEIAPALYLDADAIEVVDVRDGVVQVRLGGACGGCPSTIMTVIMGIEQELRRRVPGVEYLEALP
ncbi:MAG TPA: NifU family protein [Gemmataceae bacterium]|nr:NifU family protein [Gemmataceae bacterium]